MRAKIGSIDTFLRAFHVKRLGAGISIRKVKTLEVNLMDRALKKGKTNRFSVRVRRVLDEAEELFVREGFLHFSTDELTRRLRCSKRTIYLVAPGREKFFEAVVFQQVKKNEEAIIAIIRNTPSVRAAVQSCIQANVDHAKAVSPLWMRDLMLFPAGRRVAEKWRANVANELEHLIERGISEGIFRRIDSRVAAEVLLTSVLRMCEPDFSANSRTTTAEAVRQVYEIFWAGLFCGRRDGEQPSPQKWRALQGHSELARERSEKRSRLPNARAKT